MKFCSSSWFDLFIYPDTLPPSCHRSKNMFITKLTDKKKKNHNLMIFWVLVTWPLDQLHHHAAHLQQLWDDGQNLWVTDVDGIVPVGLLLVADVSQMEDGREQREDPGERDEHQSGLAVRAALDHGLLDGSLIFKSLKPGLQNVRLFSELMWNYDVKLLLWFNGGSLIFWQRHLVLLPRAGWVEEQPPEVYITWGVKMNPDLRFKHGRKPNWNPRRPQRPLGARKATGN